ncbi:MAG TPA: cache domain-containing protein [Spirochaetota bacterium]|nr:cache domain-containing protein [Spirochaetota bacterium]HPJ34183.1 cache domain-containing protein [Spirochaetota bacterium]
MINIIKKMKWKIFAVATIISILLPLLYISYTINKEETINKITYNLKILAMQSSTGIENLFQTYISDLKFLADTDGIIKTNNEGKRLIKVFFETHKNNLTSVTRIDSTGKILYSAPYNKNIIGIDVSTQPHNREMNTKLVPVISDLFTAAQGYKALAVHVPVYDNGKYAGRISILMKFDHIAETFLKNIKTGKSGFSWVITENGDILFHPDKKLIDLNADVYSNNIPMLKSAVKKMKSGEEGKTWYKDNDRLYFLYYYPVNLLTTHWSIAITIPEDELLDAVTEFKNLWLLLIFLFIALNIFYLVNFLINYASIKAQNRKLSDANSNLKNAMLEINNLNKLIPICSSCKKIRDDAGYWSSVETYLDQHSDAELTHSLCPDCLKKLYPEKNPR